MPILDETAVERLVDDAVLIVVKPRSRSVGQADVLVAFEEAVRNLHTYFGRLHQRFHGNTFSLSQCEDLRSRRGDQVVANSVPDTQPIRDENANT
jgi:hypothetical protein